LSGNPAVQNRSPYRQQGDRNRRCPLLVGSIFGIVNSVLAKQPNVGEKPIVEPVQAIVLRFFVLSLPAAAKY